jgi:uncharacterized protein (DUF4415 family)
MKKRSSNEPRRRRTDWSRLDALSDRHIAAAARNDPDAAPILDKDWFATARIVMPEPKQSITIRLDRDVLAHFRRHPRYQTRINAILRSVMDHERKKRKSS